MVLKFYQTSDGSGAAKHQCFSAPRLLPPSYLCSPSLLPPFFYPSPFFLPFTNSNISVLTVITLSKFKGDVHRLNFLFLKVF